MLEWEQIEPTGDIPPNTCKCGFLTLNEEQIIVFGGSSGFGYNNDIWILDVKKKEWSLIETTGEKPSPRSGVTAVIYKDSLFVFGGFDRRKYYGDFYKLDLNTWTWKELPQGPSGRHSHVGNLYGDDKYIFGGRLNTEGKRANDLWKYSIKSEKWEEMKPFGHIPSARSSLVSAVFEDLMFIFGGIDDQEEGLNDLYSYSFSNNTWSLIHTQGEVEPPLCVSPSAVLSGSYLLVIGGQNRINHERFDFDHVYAFDILRSEWEKWDPAITKNQMSKRSCHVSAMVGSKVVVFGGEVLVPVSYYKHMNEVWILHLLSDLVNDLSHFQKELIFCDV